MYYLIMDLQNYHLDIDKQRCVGNIIKKVVVVFHPGYLSMPYWNENFAHEYGHALYGDNETIASNFASLSVYFIYPE